MHSKTSRRTFVKALAAGGVLASFGLWRSPVWAITSQGQPNVLADTDFELSIGEMGVNFTGTPRTAMTINGSLPGPILRWREGDTVTISPCAPVSRKKAWRLVAVTGRASAV